MNIQTPESSTSDRAPMRLAYPTDMVGRLLTETFEQPIEPPPPGIFKRAIGQRGSAGTWWYFALGFPVITLAILSISVFNDDPSIGLIYWEFAGIGMLVQVALLWAIGYVRREATKNPDGLKIPSQISIRSLRRAAMAGNDELAPPVAAQDAPQPVLQIGTNPELIRVLPPQWRFQRGAKILTGVLAIGVALYWAAQWVISAVSGDLQWQIISFYPLYLIMLVWIFIWCIRASRSFSVEVRENGLHWRKQILPWSEIRNWHVIYLHPINSSWTHPNVVYVVVGQHATLVWLTYPPHIDSHEPGMRLAQLVQAHVNLPLRDLTPSAIRISYEVGQRFFTNGSRLLAVNDRNVWGGNLPRLPAAIVTFAFSVLILLAGILAPYAQQQYFGRQLTQLQTSRSALRNPMTANTLGWKTAPLYGDHNTFTFTPQGYTYPAEECCGASSLSSQSINVGLVEITIHQQAADDIDSAGIVFRANSHARTAFVFIVTPDGDWRLDRYTLRSDGTFAESDFLRTDVEQFGVSAIHQGRDVTNRQAVLMQGSILTFFINGQFVGRYWNTDLPQSGQVGVYTNGYENTVTFSDLLISPS